MRRLFTTATIAVALSIPAVATLGFAGVAGASAPVPTAGSSVACTKVSYSNTTGEATVSKCYTASGKTAKAFKTLVAMSASTLLNGGTLTWSPGPGTITTSALTSATPTGTCSSKDTQAAYSGTVQSTTGTGNPVNSAYANDVVYVDVCLATTKTGIKVSFAKGTDGEF